MRPVGTYFETSASMYQPPPAANPGWALAPVPGWGMNPERSGPPMLAMNGADIPISSVLPDWAPVRQCTACSSVRGGALGDSESDANEGYIALAAAGGIFLGWFLSWAYHYHKSQKKKRG